MTNHGIQRLLDDHRRVETLIAEVSDPAVDRGWTIRTLVETLSRHDAVEIEVLYPVLRVDVGGGEALTDEAEAQHQAIDLLLSKIDRRSLSDPAVGELFAELVAQVGAHVRHEEEVVFPAIRAALPSAAWIQLGKNIDAAWQDASTHPHPHLGRSRIARKAAKTIDRGRKHTINR
ncbi:MAG: hemerythrin domain-containing protein [Actinomycetota bacterium]|nr:hemerythrin domain-containing protein [Actinomycetota bacterium]